jgi:hypothetical protein
VGVRARNVGVVKRLQYSQQMQSVNINRHNSRQSAAWTGV